MQLKSLCRPFPVKGGKQSNRYQVSLCYIVEMKNFVRKFLLFANAVIVSANAYAALGMVELAADSTSGPVTVFYPTLQAERSEQRGFFQFDVAKDAPPVAGNRHLIVISHGSPASPWVYLDLVRALVNAGFIVAMPEHYADNYKDDSEPGPPSWKRRPKEVSQAINRIGKEPRFTPLVNIASVGMYGMSAGGHTALTLAGGRWSPSRLRDHCQEHINDDFHTCAGLSTSLTGGVFDGLKKTLVQMVSNGRLNDPSWYEHTDPRITAIVAGVPFAVDFDPNSLMEPKTKLGIISALADKWLTPKFHSEPILRGCKACENILELRNGGHGALLSPLPPKIPAPIAVLIGDPPDFQRETEVPRINSAITEFFIRHLLADKRQGLSNSFGEREH